MSMHKKRYALLTTYPRLGHLPRSVATVYPQIRACHE